MIQIEEIKRVPQLIWTAHSSREFSEQAVADIEEASTIMWLVRGEQPLAVAGVIHTSLSTAPWFWFLLTQDLRAIHAREMLPLARRLTPRTLTAVADDFAAGCRFASFFGFTETLDKVKGYRIYRKL